ncbi:MAG: MaoC family dehydratase N-terminal domain-containing protein [Candidatus Rokubacteria bacterium]|nr:MaoC family dehydratase N-terminal domain-containing protein [Candidatus Rokubacteria bacterium]MBI3825022.1 MaoC family dehydratase N-terminal domain-containing protein [Candidatus Rokubacteria bacterium]
MTLALPPGLVATSVGPLAAEVDARWLMAYAAGLGESGARYYDTAGAGGPAAHPLFAVCYEWPLALLLRGQAIPDAVARRGVHATHHLVIHRPPRAGDALSTTARIVGVAGRRAGALVVLRFETVDAAGAPVTSTLHGSVYRGVACEDEGQVDALPEAPGGPPRWDAPVPVAAGAAHVYTETARIWNPIHTDLAVARAAGLPGLILHGTATLALAVSRLIERELGGDPGRVRAVSGRFSGMVAVPSTIVVRGGARRGDAIALDVLDATGAVVLSQGVVAA